MPDAEGMYYENTLIANIRVFDEEQILLMSMVVIEILGCFVVITIPLIGNEAQY
jgi:hypothetical protein